ncbi:MAG: cation-transporting P-type ATPase [Polyangiaceae bacterium]
MTDLEAKGLATSDAQDLLARFGPNEPARERRSPRLLRFSATRSRSSFSWRAAYRPFSAIPSPRCSSRDSFF